MDVLIGQPASKAGIDDIVAEKTIGIMPGFVRSEGPSDKVQVLIDEIPGAEVAMAAASTGRGLSMKPSWTLTRSTFLIEYHDISHLRA